MICLQISRRLETLIKVVKSAGNLVGTHLAPLLSALLEATQVAEGQSLNYPSVRLGNQLATQEKNSTWPEFLQLKVLIFTKLSSM